MKPIIKIVREWQDLNQTLGQCSIYIDGKKPIFSSVCLERGWRNNQKRVSCIPTGTYNVVLEYSNRFKKDLWEIKGVENRSECKFHSANYWYQLNGCIALGRDLGDINNDGYNDVRSSKSTMNTFHKVLRKYKEAVLVIEYSEKCECN